MTWCAAQITGPWFTAFELVRTKPFACCIAVLLALLGGLPAKEVAAQDLPRIVNHSQSELRVYRGDRVRLTVDAVGDDLDYKWLRGDEVMCRAADCEIATANLELGNHRLVMVVFNEAGSRFLFFQLSVLVPPPEYNPGNVTPPMAQEVMVGEGLATDSLQVRAHKGRGYAYHLSKIQVLGPTARSLTWSERLRTQRQGILHFGRRGMEDHWLMPRGWIKLSTTDVGRRRIDLRTGVLRARHHGDQAPRYSITAGDWLQIDPTIGTDFIVRRKGVGTNSELVTVIVLRGAVRLFVATQTTDEAGTAKPGFYQDLQAGAEISYSPNVQAMAASRWPNANAAARIVRLTTPFVLRGGPQKKDFGRLGTGWESFDEARRAAIDSLRNQDPIFAFEGLLPFVEESAKDSVASMAIAEGLMALHLNRAAERWIKRVTALEPQSGRPWLQWGRSLLGRKQWRAAEEALSKAVDAEDVDRQQALYYLAVAQIEQDMYVAARDALTRAQWLEGDPVTGQAIRELLRYLNQQKSFDLGTWLDGRYNTNLNGLGDAHPLATDSPNDGPGYGVGLAASWWPWRDEFGGFGTSFTLERHGYTGEGQDVFTRVDQGFKLDFSLRPFATVQDPGWLGLGMSTELAMIFIGDNRAFDRLLSTFELTCPNCFNLSLRYRDELNRDPLPGEADAIDPIKGEVAGATDRSHRVGLIELLLAPELSDSSDLRFSLASGNRDYSEVLSEAETHGLLQVQVGYGWRPTGRQHYQFGLGFERRSFDQLEESASDTLVDFQLAWRYWWTPALSTTPRYEYTTVSSDRDDHSYDRHHLQLRLDFEL